MFCDFCKRELADCPCADIDVRLRTLRRSGSVVMPWCPRCDRHLDRCHCPAASQAVAAPLGPELLPRRYVCLTCGRSELEPLPTRFCRHCREFCCAGCLPDHEMLCARELKKLEALSTT